MPLVPVVPIVTGVPHVPLVPVVRVAPVVLVAPKTQPGIGPYLRPYRALEGPIKGPV